MTLPTLETTDVALLVEQLPDADRPGTESKLTGPEREAAEKIVQALLAGGPQSLRELAGMVRDGFGGGEKNYKPGYALRCVALRVGAEGREKERRVFSEALASHIGGDGLPKAAQAFLVRELQLVGGPESVGVLAGVLDDGDLGSTAALALVAIREGAAEALRSALSRVSGRNRLAVIQALGSLGDAESTQAVAGALGDPDSETRVVAARALAGTGSPQAVAPLLEATGKAQGWERVQAAKACLLLAETLLDAGKARDAREIAVRLRELWTAPHELYVREAAGRILARIDAAS